jgi:proton glutamate symport protein
VVAGLVVVLFVVYPIFLWLGAGYSIADFFRGMAPAQLLAFSTSSSNATLPVTLERVEQNLGVSGEVAGFVLPLGATINMDGTSLYQAVATVFIAQAFGIPLDWGDQLTIVLTATLASIGSAGVPGAGMVMLVVVLESVGLDPAGIALIMAVDRILDMARTVVNVSGDAMVAVLVARRSGDLSVPPSK